MKTIERPSNDKKVGGSNGHSQLRLFTTDWSGVFSDDRRPVYEANMRMLERGGKARMTFEQWLPLTKMTPIEFVASQGVTVTNPKEMFREYGQIYTQIREEGINPVAYPDARVTMAFFRMMKLPVIVVSSHPEEHLRREAEGYGLEDHITHFMGNMTDKAKGILKACATAGVSPLHASYIGDTVYDIMAAKKAGVLSIGITTGYHVRRRLANETPDLLVDSLTELRGKLYGFLRRDAAEGCTN